MWMASQFRLVRPPLIRSHPLWATLRQCVLVAQHARVIGNGRLQVEALEAVGVQLGGKQAAQWGSMGSRQVHVQLARTTQAPAQHPHCPPSQGQTLYYFLSENTVVRPFLILRLKRFERADCFRVPSLFRFLFCLFSPQGLFLLIYSSMIRVFVLVFRRS
jgi:hypothetical protein